MDEATCIFLFTCDLDLSQHTHNRNAHDSSKKIHFSSHNRILCLLLFLCVCEHFYEKKASSARLDATLEINEPN